MPDVEAHHHRVCYPRFGFALNGDAPRLFAHRLLIPPGWRPSGDDPKSSVREAEEIRNFFHSVKAFINDELHCVIPASVPRVAAYADLLYRLLLCCLPTSNGGFSGDGLLLDSGAGVLIWADAVITLVEIIESKIQSRETESNTSRNKVRDAFINDLLNSSLQSLIVTILEFNKDKPEFLSDQPLFVSPSNANNHLPLFSTLRDVLLEVVNCEESHLHLINVLATNIEKSDQRKDRVSLQYNFWETGWPPIFLPVTSRPPAHILRLLAALFFRVQEFRNPNFLLPWIDLAGVLTWNLWQLQHKKQIDPEENVDHDLQAGLVAGLLVESLRGLQLLLPLTNNVPCELKRKLSAIHESLSRFRLLPVDKKGVGAVVLALRRRQLEVLHNLVRATSIAVNKNNDGFLRSFFHVYDNLYLCNPMHFGDPEKRESILQKINLSSYIPTLHLSVPWASILKKTDTSEYTCTKGFALLLAHLTGPLVEEFHPASTIMSEINALDTSSVLTQYVGGSSLLLSLLACRLSSNLENSRTAELVCRVSSFTVDSLMIQSQDFPLVLVLLRTYLLSDHEAPTALESTGVTMLRQCISTKTLGSPDLIFFALDTLLLAVERKTYSIIGVVGDESGGFLLEVVICLKQFLIIANPGCPCWLHIIRTTVQLLIGLCNLVAEANSEVRLSSPIPSIYSWVIVGLSQMCQEFITSAENSNYNLSQRTAIMSIILVDGITAILARIVTYLLNTCDSKTYPSSPFFVNSCSENFNHKTERSSVTLPNISTTDSFFVLSHIFSTSERESAFSSVMNPLLFIFNGGSWGPECLQIQTAILPNLLLLDLLLRGVESKAVSFISLPPESISSIGNEPWFSNSVCMERLPAQMVLKPNLDSTVFLTDSPSIVDSVSVVENTITNLCGHAWNHFHSNLNEEFHLFCHLKAGLTGNSPKTYEIEHHSLKQLDLSYWNRRLSVPCPKCFSPLPAVSTVELQINPCESNVFHTRFMRLPGYYRLLAAVTGTSGYHPILRQGVQISISFSAEMIQFVTQVIMMLFFSDDSLIRQDFAESFPLRKKSSSLLADILTILIIGGGSLICGVTDILTAVQLCLSNEANFLCSNFGICLELPGESDDTDKNLCLLSGKQLLLNQLESFHSCLLLLGIQQQQLERVAGSLEGSHCIKNLEDKYVCCATSTVINGVNSAVSEIFIPFRSEIRTLTFSCTFPEEFLHPVILTARRFVDRLRFLLLIPNQSAGYPRVRAASHFDVDVTTMSQLLIECSRFSEFLRTEREALMCKDPFGFDSGVTLRLQEAISASNKEILATENQRLPENNPIFWAPPQLAVQFLSRNLTPNALSSFLIHLLSILRRLLRLTQTKPGTGPSSEIMLIATLDILTVIARSLGLGSFPFLLTLLDTRPLLTLLASSLSEKPSSCHLNLLLWWYGLATSNCLTRESLPGWRLFVEHLIRVSYHPLGRRIMHQMERLLGPIIPDVHRGLVIVTSCSSWISRSVPRLHGAFEAWAGFFDGYQPVDTKRLRDAWESVTKRLRQSGSVQRRTSLESMNGISDRSPYGVAGVVEDDVKRSEKMLRASTEVQLLLRELWDASGPNALTRVGFSRDAGLSNNGIEQQANILSSRISLIVEALHPDEIMFKENEQNRLALSTDMFLQMWEMLRCLWTPKRVTEIPPSTEADKNDTTSCPSEALHAEADSMFAKAFRALEPLFSPPPFRLVTVTVIERPAAAADGVVRRAALFFDSVKTHPEHEIASAWRVCRTVNLYLCLLGKGIVYETGGEFGKTLEQHIAMIVTLLSSLSDAFFPLCPLALYDCWDCLISHGSSSVLHSFAPAVIWRLVQLRSVLLPKFKEGGSAVLHRLDSLIFDMIENMRAVETRKGSVFARFHLSAFCEVLFRFSRDSISHTIQHTTTHIQSEGDRSYWRLASGMVQGAGPALRSEELGSEVKTALLEALALGLEYFECSSVLDLQTKAEGTNEETAALMDACLRLTAETENPDCLQLKNNTSNRSNVSVAIKAAEVLGLCGALHHPLKALQPNADSTTLKLSPLRDNESSPFVPCVWWDSCPHFLAVRVAEQLMYPNISNRVSLYFIQELLKYIDFGHYNETDIAHGHTCSHHDSPTAATSVWDFVSDKVKRLGASLKSSRYTLSIPPNQNHQIHKDLLHSLACNLLARLSASDAEVFIRSGVEFSSYLPDVLRFLLPRLILISLSRANSEVSMSVDSENIEDSELINLATTIAGEVVNILDQASQVLSSNSRNAYPPKTEMFSVYDPIATCQIIFEAVDSLASLLHIYLNSDRRTLPDLQEQSKTNPYLRQCLTLSLPRHAWSAVQTFLQIATGKNAAIAAARCGAYSRSLLYLEMAYFSQIPWASIDGGAPWSLDYSGKEFKLNDPSTMEVTSDELESILYMFVDAFRGLENWENIRGCFRTMPHIQSWCSTERLALELQSQDKPVDTAHEYLRLAKQLSSRSHEFNCKALRSLLEGQAFGSFFLEYSRSNVDIQAACVPLLMKALWQAGMWESLETIYLRYANDGKQRWDHSSARTRAQEGIESLYQWSLPETEIREQETNVAMHPITSVNSEPNYNSPIISALLLEVVPSPASVRKFSCSWSPSDNGDFLTSGVLSALHRQDMFSFQHRLARLTGGAMANLAFTARESYARSYPALVPLQLITDLTRLTRYTKNKQHHVKHKLDSSTSESNFNMAVQMCLKRVDLIVQSPRFLLDVLATLKVVFEELNNLEGVASVATRLSKVIRKTVGMNFSTERFPCILPGKYQLADLLPLLTTQMNTEPNNNIINEVEARSLSLDVRMELAKTLPQSLRTDVLSPFCEMSDSVAVRHAKLSCSSTHVLSEKLRIMQQVVEQHPNSERSHRCLAELLDGEIQKWINSTIEESRKKDDKRQKYKSSVGALDDIPNFPKGWSILSLVEAAIRHHLEAAVWANSTHRARFHLLKFLQLLVDVFFGDLSPTGKLPREGRVGASMFTSEIQELFVQQILTLIEKQITRIPVSHWYLGVSQLIARCQHRQLGPTIFQPLLARLLLHTPHQMAWHLGPLFCAERSERRDTASMILNAARRMKYDDGRAMSRPEVFVERTVAFAGALISLATNTFSTQQTKTDGNLPQKTKISVEKDVPELARVINKSSRLPSVDILLPLLSQLDSTHEQLVATTPITIIGVEDNIIIMRSKQRPKRLTLQGSDGREYHWLVKRESRGDLRKDARLMEVAGYVNSWVEKAEKSRQKTLKIRRYSVIPLNEVTGLIEWISNLVTLRSAVLEIWESEMGQDRFMSLMKKVIARYNRHRGNVTALHADYRDTLHTFKPVLQKFYFDRFGCNVALWYACRKTFSESLASWSMLGYVLGLGDRHGENILLDLGTGQVVHVDFDCLFGKGLHLPVPEIVPFRLTQNLVAALGFGGLRGGFVSACANTLTTLKQYHIDFLSILQSFIFDPLIEWTRSGKAVTTQQQEDDYTGGGARARQFLADIEIKLKGGVNFHSQRLFKNGQITLTSNLPSIQENPQYTVEDTYQYVTSWVVDTSVTVENQVDELSEAACCGRNLALMYVGWMPWL